MHRETGTQRSARQQPLRILRASLEPASVSKRKGTAREPMTKKSGRQAARKGLKSHLRLYKLQKGAFDEFTRNFANYVVADKCCFSFTMTIKAIIADIVALDKHTNMLRLEAFEMRQN